MLCALWIETQTGKIRGDNLKLEIVEGADRDWSGYYDRITAVTDEWLSQQPRSEGQPSSESASPVDIDQIPSVPASRTTIRGRAKRFSGQVL